MSRSTNDRLARLLDSPLLERVVPHLPPETLHQLIQYRGLDACGDLVASATPAQLSSLLDLDLWRHAQAGRDEQFDVDRFGEWVEVLVDTGESVAARTVAALDTHLVILGLSRYLRVFDPGTFEPTESSDDEPMDRQEKMNSEPTAASNHLAECEVGGYLVRARRTDAWDAIVTLLLTLQTEQSECFHALMRGCRGLSNSTPEIDGLDDLLMPPEQHLQDVAIDRERRRSQKGYVTPGDARAFLHMARQPRVAPAPGVPPSVVNPIATAYFRDLDDDVAAAADDEMPAADVSTSIAAAMELLAEAGVAPEPPRALLAAADEDPRAARLPLLRPLMAFVLQNDETAYLARSRELAFLANTLLAGCAVQSRPLTPAEASDAAACICNLGVECWPVDAPNPSDEFLVDHDLVTAFEVGWSVLHRDVSLFVSDRLAATLADLHCADADTRRGLVALRRTLVKHRKAGTPWLARGAADVLGMLDMTAWISVLGLLDECPIMPAALTAILERRTQSVSPTAFEFISTTAQIGDIRVFMGMLPGVLAG